MAPGYPLRVTLRAYLRWLRPHAPALTVAAALLGVGGALPGAAVWLLQDGLGRLQDPLGLAGVAAASLLVVLAHSLAQVVRASLTRRVAGAVASDLRARVHAAWLAGNGTVGEGLSAVLDEVDQVQFGVSALVTAIRNPIALAALLGSALVLAPALTALALALFGAVAALGIWSTREVKRATAAARQARAALASLAAEQLANAEVIRTFGAEGDELRRFRARDDRDRDARIALELARVWPSSAVEVAGAAAVGAVMVAGASQVAAGALDGPTLLSVVAALVLANRPLSGLTEVQTLLARSLAALARVEALLDRALPPAPEPLPPGPVEIAWDRIRVTLGGRAVLAVDALRANPGEILAVVGPSGAGKTTLLRTAIGAAPYEGAVSVGGVPARGAPSGVAFVAQDIGLFARTVAENVALGEATPDRRRARAALDAAAFVGVDLDRALGERGAGLSGGERQRLCLARALYRDARVLLFDEPTAQLDRATAAAFVATLRALRPGRTLVVATHDPVVWEQADRVVHLRDGRVIEEGAWTDSLPR